MESTELAPGKDPLASVPPIGSEAESVFVAGNLALDVSERSVRIDGCRVNLTFQEFEVLTVLLKHKGIVLPRKTFCASIWGSGGVMEGKRLSVVISRLRQKLQDVKPYSIRAVRSRGYGLLA